MTRTFIALEMDESLQSFLGDIIRKMAQELPNLRWLDPGGIHLTLAFLGELNDDQLEEAISAAGDAAHRASPFSYRLSGLGVFGSPHQPRVIWVGIEESSGRLARLHRILNKELERRGFEVDRRPFSPHLTLSRVKAPLKPDEQQRLQRLLVNSQIAKSSPVSHIHHLNVMKSELSRTGAKYTRLHEFELGGQGE